MEDLTRHWRSLSLLDREGAGLHLRSDQATIEHGIVTRFLTKRPLNIEAIANTFTPFWRSKSSFKVQIFDIPLRFKHRKIAEQICEPIGMILHPNETLEYDGGSFTRVRVLMDISQPLCRGRLITLEDDKPHWVSFKYERLPNLSYWGGCLTHDDKDCETWIESEGNLKPEDQQFRSWLRAPPFNALRKKVVSVPVFFAKKNPGHTTPPTMASPLSSPMTVHLATSSTTPPPPRTLNERPGNQGIGNQGAESASVSDPAHRGFLKKSEKSSVPISSKLDDFEKTLQDLDNDIHGFDKTPKVQKSKDRRGLEESQPSHLGTAGPDDGVAGLVFIGQRALQEFHRAQSSPIPTSKSVIPIRWSPPPAGWVKVNFDGAPFKEKNLAGLGGVIHNDIGLIMAAFTQTIPLPTSVEMVKVLAARSALGLAQELCLNKVQLEGDSDINQLEGARTSSYGHIIMDINQLSYAFQCLSFCHTRRPGNKVVHKLARSACLFSPFQVINNGGGSVVGVEISVAMGLALWVWLEMEMEMAGFGWRWLDVYGFDFLDLLDVYEFDFLDLLGLI
ncbi:hypothetical protein SO802_008717 [Lithocarpus litseifolius]|uniref:RNase H type-1 domain-containing protein n=1 Tax=Lithocarpus litseifolius TaxID=425828 RepID=A0AAW2D9F4_9ROSI